MKQLKCYRESFEHNWKLVPWKQITWKKKIEFTTPSVNADLFESLGWWLVQASQTYVHFTKKRMQSLLAREGEKKKKEQILIVETQKKN